MYQWKKHRTKWNQHARKDLWNHVQWIYIKKYFEGEWSVCYIFKCDRKKIHIPRICRVRIHVGQRAVMTNSFDHTWPFSNSKLTRSDTIYTTAVKVVLDSLTLSVWEMRWWFLKEETMDILLVRRLNITLRMFSQKKYCQCLWTWDMKCLGWSLRSYTTVWVAGSTLL